MILKYNSCLVFLIFLLMSSCNKTSDSTNKDKTDFNIVINRHSHLIGKWENCVTIDNKGVAITRNVCTDVVFESNGEVKVGRAENLEVYDWYSEGDSVLTVIQNDKKSVIKNCFFSKSKYKMIFTNEGNYTEVKLKSDNYTCILGK